MSHAFDRVLDRRVQFDPKSRLHPVRRLVEGKTPRSYTWRCHTWLDQGSEGACVGFSWAHELASTPVEVPATNALAFQLYDRARELDEWPGSDYEGTSVLAGAKAAREGGYIGWYNWAFSLDDLILAVGYQGPAVLGLNWYECLVAGTRVLTHDLEWLPVEKLSPGDELIGFDESAPFSRYRPTTVLSNDRLIRPVVRVTTERGEIVVSTNHRFVRCDRSTGRSWAFAGDLTPGDRLAFMADPWGIDRSWEAGYLAGFYDGEGSLAQDCRLLSASQKEGPTMDRVLKILDAKGFEYRRHLNRNTGVWHWNIAGEYAASLAFLGSIRPERLLAQSDCLWRGRQTWNNRATPVTVQDVTPLGEEEVFAAGTSSGTLITEGLLSHNSMMEPDDDGFVEPSGDVLGGHAILCRGVSLHQGYFTLRNSWSQSWGLNGDCRVRIDDLGALLDDDGEACIPHWRMRPAA